MSEPQDPATKKGKRFVPRFAGEAFAHAGAQEDAPMLRKLASEVAWKRPPNTELSTDY